MFRAILPLAARLTDEIPSSLRAAWIRRVAQGYATADGAGAIDWISRYEGQDGFAAGMRLVLVGAPVTTRPSPHA